MFLNLALSSVLSIGLYYIAITAGNSSGSAVAILALSIVPFGTMLFSSIRDNGGLLTLILSFYFIFFMTFPGMLHVSTGDFPFFGLNYPDSDIQGAAFVALAFSISAFLGSALAAVHRDSIGIHSYSVPVGVSYRAVFVLILVSIVLIVLIGPGAFVRRRSDVIEVAISGELSLILMGLARACAVVALLSILHRLRFSKTDLTWGLFFLMAIGVNLVANYPLGIPRFLLFAILIAALHFLTDISRPRFKAAFVFLAVFAMGTVFPFASYLQRGELSLEYSIDFLEYFKTSGDLDGFQSMINVYILADGTGIRWGWQMLSALLAPVPRRLWPGKGQSTGPEAADYVGYDYTNISSPFPSELFLDFGFVGVIIGGFLLGLFLKKADYLYNISLNRSTVRHCLYYGLLAGHLTIIMRGSLLSVIAPIAVIFLVSYLVTRFSQHAYRSPTQAEGPDFAYVFDANKRL